MAHGTLLNVMWQPGWEDFGLGTRVEAAALRNAFAVRLQNISK